jgi:dihydroorotate dehydrogenase electron transfer subunit
VRVLSGTVLERESVWSAAARLRLAVPDLGLVAPGQYVLVKRVGRRDPLLARPAMPCAQAPAGDMVDILEWYGDARYDEEQGTWREGDLLQVTGPAGRPFQIDNRTRRVLLVGMAEGLGPLLLLTRVLVERGVEVTFVSRQHYDGSAMPGAALPPEVEYVVAPGADRNEDRPLVELVEQLIAWADQLYVALPPALLPAMLNLMRRRLLRVRKGFAQALVSPALLPCGVGACDLCALPVREGYRRLCRDGLVFDLLSLT